MILYIKKSTWKFLFTIFFINLKYIHLLFYQNISKIYSICARLDTKKKGKKPKKRISGEEVILNV